MAVQKSGMCVQIFILFLTLSGATFDWQYFQNKNVQNLQLPLHVGDFAVKLELEFVF